VFVPASSSPVKVDRLRRYGATVTVGGDNYADAFAASHERAQSSRALIITRTTASTPGQGTVAHDLDDQLSNIDTVAVVVGGGGGLIGGIASWYVDHAKVNAVEPGRIPTLAAALQAGRPVDFEVGGIAATCLAPNALATSASPQLQQPACNPCWSAMTPSSPPGNC